jgi:hypothetical protein
MNLVRLFVIFLSTFLWVSSLYAQVYQWTDENGVKHFSNVSPSESSEEISIGEEQSGEKRTKANNRKTRKVHKSTRKAQEKAKPVPENESAPQSKPVKDNRTVFERVRLNIGRFPITQDELIREEKERLKQLENYSKSASLSREEMIEREKKRLEIAIQDLQRAPLDKFGSYDNKRRQVGYYRYRLEELLESPDTYFRVTSE